MLTACGIETDIDVLHIVSSIPVATVLTACGIETYETILEVSARLLYRVATVLTACGIETLDEEDVLDILEDGCNSAYRLRY